VIKTTHPKFNTTDTVVKDEWMQDRNPHPW
jgi:hypothetical protein